MNNAAFLISFLLLLVNMPCAFRVLNGVNLPVLALYNHNVLFLVKHLGVRGAGRVGSL